MRFIGNPRVSQRGRDAEAQWCAAQQCVKLLPGNDREAIKESHSFKCLGVFDCDDLFW